MFTTQKKIYKWGEGLRGFLSGRGGNSENMDASVPGATVESSAELEAKARGLYAEFAIIAADVLKEVDPPVHGLRPLQEVNPSGDHQAAGRIANETMLEIKAAVNGKTVDAAQVELWDANLTQAKMLMERNR
jgi:hypothetical protein